ncbi:TetR/AcrR family transcriptional regulator [Rhodocytophaga rosea]|uniref:TetR/AcrR family transcriptional regulator n=1 Tax=Rhodocytophaga rosea TaxID=2704465 RepID=A0A6C0GNW6_9BACT|nr:TetR/AcrR family transcriptional regulator [Rhodocytophaga rosea]QHT69729.1 TetR/AcrR family transcriptional regulator [Rhodocytophaga rosea]
MARTKEFDTKEVLEKAVELFSCKGYNGASMQDVVDCLGLSRSSLYDTFGDKRQLYLEALKRYKQQNTAAVVDLIHQSKDIKSTIREMLLTAVQESFQDQQRKGCFMVNTAVEMAPHDPEFARLVQANMQEVENAFCEAIKNSQSLGQMSAVHEPRSLARFIFNTISGLRVAAKSGADKKVFDDIINVTMSVL